jgi:hypothetical protein
MFIRLEISCDNESYGCEVITKLDLLPHHLKECEHNPKKLVSCLQGCGLTVPKDEMKVTQCLLNNIMPFEEGGYILNYPFYYIIISNVMMIFSCKF